MISNAVYITSFISVTAIFIFGSYFQRRTEKMAAKSREENIKSNNELIATLESLNVSASQLNTFKHHIRILLVELEKDREERISLAIKEEFEKGEFPVKLLYKEVFELSQFINERGKYFDRKTRNELEERLFYILRVFSSKSKVGRDGQWKKDTSRVEDVEES